MRHRRQRERDQVRVVNVHRLPGGGHHIVPEVDEQADAAFADTGEPAAQPQRRGQLIVKLELDTAIRWHSAGSMVPTSPDLGAGRGAFVPGTGPASGSPSIAENSRATPW